MNKDVFRKFEQRARLGVLSDDELKRYERSLKVYRDNLAVEGGVEYRIRTSRTIQGKVLNRTGLRCRAVVPRLYVVRLTQVLPVGF